MSKANSTHINLSTGLDTLEFIEKIVKPLNLDYHIHTNISPVLTSGTMQIANIRGMVRR